MQHAIVLVHGEAAAAADSLKCWTNRWVEETEQQVCASLGRGHALAAHVRARARRCFTPAGFRAEVAIFTVNLRVNDHVF